MPSKQSLLGILPFIGIFMQVKSFFFFLFPKINVVKKKKIR